MRLYYGDKCPAPTRGQAGVCLLIILCAVHACGKPISKPTRNVTVDELLDFGVVPSASDIPSGSGTPSDDTGHDSIPTAGVLGFVSNWVGRTHHHRPAAPPLGEGAGAGVGAGPELLTDAAGTIHPPGASAADSPADSEFIFVTGTCMKRRLLARASRGWRSPQLRAFFLTDSEEALPSLNAEGAAAGESYAFFPSEGSPELGGWFRGLRGGDSRAAAAPFAAHRHFGDTYKWILYGDDDTVFYMDAVKHLVSRFDPDQPVAISDNLWSRNRHPNPHAPRCLPCDMANETLPSLETILLSSLGRADIRVTYEHCYGKHTVSQEEYRSFARNTTLLPGERYMPRPACPYCTREAACAPVAESGSGAPCPAATAHGGVGMILSVGLLRRITLHSALECILSLTNSTGGDHMVSECLWRHNIAFTDPGPSVRHGYDQHYVMFGGWAGFTSMLDPGGPVLRSGRCDQRCMWALRRVVTTHVQARTSRKWQALAARQHELPALRLAACSKLLTAAAVN